MKVPVRLLLVFLLMFILICLALMYRSLRVASVTKRSVSSSHKDRFILFDGDLSGQGLGNIVSGLLAAHLLGQEFNRIVCILPYSYRSFVEVFEPSHPLSIALCPGVLQARPRRTRTNQFRLVNYDSPPDECALQQLLQSDVPVLYMVGNTYPRWPKVPDRFFFQHYRPQAVLVDVLSLIHSRERTYVPIDLQHLLPYTTAVHLRSPDSNDPHHGDVRLGLDPASLAALEHAVPQGPLTYLVTNRVAYYQQFADCCQWSHPPWLNVIHSSNGRMWGTLDPTSANKNRTDGLNNNRPSQNVQMWADWYALLTAPTVYHIHSDFSISAIHWMNNRQSYSIKGADAVTGALKTQPESWWIDGETTPLSERSLEAKGTAKLRLCRQKQRVARISR